LVNRDFVEMPMQVDRTAVVKQGAQRFLGLPQEPLDGMVSEHKHPVIGVEFVEFQAERQHGSWCLMLVSVVVVREQCSVDTDEANLTNTVRLENDSIRATLSRMVPVDICERKKVAVSREAFRSRLTDAVGIHRVLKEDVLPTGSEGIPW
jgi:hypothetical protein